MNKLYTKPAPTKPAGARGDRKRAWRRFLPYLGTAVVVLLIAAGFWPRAVSVEIGTVTRGPMTVSVLEEGKTRIRHRYTVSAPVPGFLERVPLRAGAPIKAGETVLASIRAESTGFLDPRTQAQAEARLQTAEAAVSQRKAEVERADAALDLAKKEFARAEQLHKSGASSKQEWDLADNTVQMRMRERNAAEFGLRMAEFEINQTRAALLQGEEPGSTKAAPLEVRAPVDGYILKVFEESARVATPGMPIMEVGDPEDLEAEIELLSSDAVQVQPGADVTIEHWGGAPLRGKVSLVEPGGYTKYSALGVEEQRTLVRVDLIDPIPPGSTLGDRFRVEARIVIWHGEDVLRIPAGALYRRGNKWMTFVDRGGRAHEQEVEVGRNNGVEAEVLSGVSENDRVVVHPPDKLADGMRIRAEG